MTRRSLPTPAAANLAAATASEVNVLLCGSTRLAAGTLTLPGMRPGRPYRLGSRPWWNCGPSALTITISGSLLAASTVSFAECGRAEQGWKLRGLEQSADEKLRHLYRAAGVPLKWHGMPPSAASNRRRRTAPRSPVPPYLVPYADRGMEDQELARPCGQSQRIGTRGAPSVPLKERADLHAG
jgi:hypothetical protein